MPPFFIMRNTLGKDERLKSRKSMDLLFKSGQSFAVFPIRVIWLKNDMENPAFPVQVMFSATKKKFKKATDRNRIKRLMREAYRLNKQLLYEPLRAKGVPIIAAFIYTGQSLPQFEEVQDKIILTLQRLANESTTDSDEKK